MNTRKLMGCAAVAALLAGCVPIMSLHPLATQETVAFEEKLLGTWVDEGETSEFTWEFARLEADTAGKLPPEWRDYASQGYRVNVTGEKGEKGTGAAFLVKLRDKLFLDIIPDKFPSGEQDIEATRLPYNALFFLRVHTFVRVASLGDKLTLGLTDDEKFQKLLEAEPNAVKHDTIDDRTVLTASTPELQTFVTKYGADERLFSTVMNLRRKAASTAK